MPDVFISYASPDRAIANATVAALEARGISCWIAPRNIGAGDTWMDAIVDAIAQCRAMVLILSAAANRSNEVKREVNLANGNAALTVVPLRIEPILPSGGLAYYLNSLHWRDASERPIAPHLEALATAMAAFLAGETAALAGIGPPPRRAVAGREAVIAAVGEVDADLDSEMLDFLPPYARLPRNIHLALTRVDRDEERQLVGDSMDGLARLRTKNAMLVIPRGVRLDCHPSFVIRCAYVECQEILGQQSDIQYLGRVPWDPKAKSLLPVLRGIAEAMKFPPSCRSEDQILARLETHGRSICFSHYVDPSQWDSQASQLAAEWIEFLATKWPATGPGCITVAFLCLNFGESAGRVRRLVSRPYRAFANFADRLSVHRDRHGELIVLPEEFGLVRRHHAEDWRARVARELRLPELERVFAEAIDEMFPRDGVQRRYGEVYRTLAAAAAQGTPAASDVRFRRAGR
jgi:hypothetical protein